MSEAYRTTEENIHGFPWRPRYHEDLLSFMGAWCVQCQNYDEEKNPDDCQILQGAVLGEFTMLTHTAEGHLHCPCFVECE